MEQQKKERGFGLVEIMVMLAILCILAGGGWYVVGLQKQKSMVEAGLSAEQQEQQIADQAAFPVPAIYGGYDWQATATTSYRALYVSPSGSTTAPSGLVSGQIFDATNTDPAAIAWQKMDATAPSDQPEGFYSGDRGLLSYYDQALRAEGYQTSPLQLGQSYSGTIAPLAADGPHGTIAGYIKYTNGKLRVIIISSSDTKNEIFISDVVKLADIQ